MKVEEMLLTTYGGDLTQVPLFAVATLIMVVAGLSKKRFVWGPRRDFRRWLPFGRRPRPSGRG